MHARVIVKCQRLQPATLPVLEEKTDAIQSGGAVVVAFVGL
jgi:hypothetical protein